MSTGFGMITLVAGPTGAEEEEPTRLTPGHLILVVGPNDAGKSRFLKELSGIDPRRRGTAFLGPRLVVADVEWDSGTAARARGHALDDAPNPVREVIPTDSARSWDVLVPGLTEAADSLRGNWSALMEGLRSVDAESLPSEIRHLVHRHRDFDRFRLSPDRGSR